LAFRFHELNVPGLIRIEPAVFPDQRGWFSERWRADLFLENDIGPFVQDNLSRSETGVLRGLHYQLEPAVQGKLVQCLTGSILDVAVDIRRHSSTFGEWVAETLSAENHRLLYLPPGFAHGFLVLAGPALVQYKVTAGYVPDLDRGIRWDDPDIGIQWPVKTPVLSEKDADLPLLKDAEVLG